MRVRAKRLGYYNHRRWKEGEVFEIKKPSDFSESWMEKLESVGEAKSKAKPEGKAKSGAPTGDQVVI